MPNKIQMIKKTQLTLVPMAGLCNRMNAILCAIAINRVVPLETKVYWMVDNDCHADFCDLFCPINGIDVKRLTSFLLLPGKVSNLYIPNLLRRLIFEVSLDGNKTTYQDVVPIIRAASNIYVSSFNRFSCQDIVSSVGDIFRPIDVLQTQIESMVSLFGEKTIGIHVRRTDNIGAISESPESKFKKYITNILIQNPQCKLYLATDDYKLKERFLTEFGDSIITRNNLLQRNTKEGIQEAVIDLYCLGKTDKILGSSNSTYSLMASYLFNKPLEICH